MSKKQMRKSFEEWAARKYGSDAITSGEWLYSNPEVRSDWGLWQASRRALVVELPKPETDGMSEVVSLVDVEDALEAAGVKYK